jgi:hypothetical protein
MDTTEDLFVYSTLCDPARVEDLLGHACPATPARLRGYQRHEGRWPYLVRTDTTGFLLRDLTAGDLAKLDAYEGVQPARIEGAVRHLYTRDRVTVQGPDDQPVPCWVTLPNLSDWKPEWQQGGASG